MDWLHQLLGKSPEIALFLSLSLGYYLGKVKFGKFQLGGVAGSLLVAVIVSQVGVHIDPGVKAVLFALFIYAVGYESGPQFFNSLGKQSVKEIILAAVLASTALATIILMAKWCGLDKGLAAGVAAGALTQSAIIGTASDAIAKLGLPAAEVAQLQGNVAVGYAVTYVFGSFGAIIVCVNLLPKLMGTSIRDDAIKAEAAMQAGLPVLAPGQQMAVADLVGRIYRFNGQFRGAAGRTVQDLENAYPAAAITVERIKRKGKISEVSPDLTLETDDILLVVGRREAMVALADHLGTELYAVEGLELIMQRMNVVLTNPDYHNQSVADIRARTSPQLRHGIYVVQLSRMGKSIPVLPETVVQQGDVVTIYGSGQDVQRVSRQIGYTLISTAKTDFVYMGAGLVTGLLIGTFTAKIGSIPLTLGSGGGALLSGLLFGWFRAKHPSMGEMPPGAVQLLKDLGLAGFVAVVGLSSGLQAVQTVRAHGMTIFLVGVVVTLLPMMITMLIGRYVLRYTNTAIFAGALSGSRSANPAFGEVLDKAENAIPTVPFAITYALANVFLTLLGPLVVALV